MVTLLRVVGGLNLMGGVLGAPDPSDEDPQPLLG